MKKHLKIIEDNRASKGLRFANFIIDRIVIYAMFFGYGVLSVLISELFSIEFFANITDDLANLSRLEDILLTAIVYFLYIFLMEFFANGRTLAKFITGTKVISIDGEKPSFQEIFIRTISRLIPFDALSFFGENGWHDTWSDTRVINVKTYNQQKFTKSDIDSIGIKEIA